MIRFPQSVPKLTTNRLSIGEAGQVLAQSNGIKNVVETNPRAT
jgi:hypothetical protein